MNSSCPKEYPKLIEPKMECVKYSLREIINNILNEERNDKNVIEKSKEIKVYNDILQVVEKEFISDNYDKSLLINGEDDCIKAEKLIITFTTSFNQRNNINNNMTKIDLGLCEIILRNFYNLSNNETLYIKKIDIIQEKMKTLKVEYDVYAKLSGNNLINLNLTVCENNEISLIIPIEINDHIDKFNSSSRYYDDICYTTTSEDGADILLKDRQREFIDKDRIICQEDCRFSEYNYETSQAKCSCKVKEFAQSFADMYINKEKLLDNFKNIKNYLNFNFLVCYKKLFTKNGILNNIGCYLILVIILIHIILICVFIIKQFPLLKDKIIEIAHEKKKDTKSKKSIKSKMSKKKRFNSKKKSVNKNLYKNEASKMKIIHKDTINASKIKINNNKFIDEEINGFSYDLARRYDKRTFFQYYSSLIKTQHNLICILINIKDYNSRIIKIDLFFIGFTIEYTLNALFYDDDTMHKIYENKGDFDLETQIPIAVYSTIISMILNYPLNFLALSNDPIIDFKQDKKNNKILEKSINLINNLMIKFILYFIISSVFLLFFWYYISMFGVIYRNTQMHLLKDTLISFGLSLIIPFVTFLFPGIFRIQALSIENKKRECMYNFSKFLQSI